MREFIKNRGREDKNTIMLTSQIISAIEDGDVDELDMLLEENGKDEFIEIGINELIENHNTSENVWVWLCDTFPELVSPQTLYSLISAPEVNASLVDFVFDHANANASVYFNQYPLIEDEYASITNDGKHLEMTLF